MEINKKAWKDVVGLKTKGVQVRKGETGVVPEFNKVQYYGQCLRNPATEIKHFHVGGLKVDQRLLAMIVNKKAWKDVVGLKTKGVQVRKGETGVVPELNKVQYYGQCLRNPATEIKYFHVGGLKVDQRLLAMIVTKS